MAAILPTPSENARKIGSLIFQRLSEVGQNEVAKTLSTSDSTISRLKQDVPQFAAMLDRLGLKVVPAAFRCEDPAYLEAMELLAHRHMTERAARARPAPTLEWPAE